MVKRSHTRVAPTAYSVARSRALSDIPFAPEIAKWLEKDLRDKKRIVSDAFKPKQVVTIEARYKLLDKLVLENCSGQVLELAAGLLPRGYLFSKKGITYVETDLANLATQKKRMYKSIFPKLPNTLFLEKADATKRKDLTRVARHFDKKKPLVVTHEGLLRYLTFEEKALVAKNIHLLLEEFGGVWITCDITLKKMLPKSTLRKIKKRIGMDVSKNAFKSVKHAKRFFSELGFSVVVHSPAEIQSELVTPKLFKLDEQKVSKMLNFVVFEMWAK